MGINGKRNEQVCLSKTVKTPGRITFFHGVSRAELKAFVAINVIMGIDQLPNLALY